MNMTVMTQIQISIIASVIHSQGTALIFDQNVTQKKSRVHFSLKTLNDTEFPVPRVPQLLIILRLETGLIFLKQYNTELFCTALSTA